MIAVYDFLWLRLGDYAAKYQSGTDTVTAFNTKLAEVQLELHSDFSPYYGKNEKVTTLLDFWVKQQTGTSPGTGIETIGTDLEIVNRIISAGYAPSGAITFAIPAVAENELPAIARIPQRAPNVSKKIVYHRFTSPDTVYFYPAAAIPYFIFYLIYPLEAHIAFTYTSTDDEDIMTYDPDNSVDLQWPESASNLILYLMLEKYGVSVREQLLQTYAEYGITRSASAGEGDKR
jgi:hypothetical protein